MKYHHLERCFTNRVKRPVVSRYLRVAGLLGLGLTGGNPTFTGWREGLAPNVSAEGSARSPVRTQPWRTLYQASVPPGSEWRVLSRDICQMGSLAGAAYLLHDNAGVLRQAQWEQNSHVEHKRKGLLD